jgi:hypothetical protein
MPRTQPELFPFLELPQWLPDELLFSLASRHHVFSGNALDTSTCVQLFGTRAGASHDFACGVDHFARSTRGQLGDAFEIIYEHTIAPFYFRLRSSLDVADACASMRADALGSIKYRLGLLTSRFRANHPLKACPQCMEEDLRSHFTPYWHLSHQYPGVWSCPVHGLALLESTVKSTGVGRFLWCLPNNKQLTGAVFDGKSTQPGKGSWEAISAFTNLVSGYAGLPHAFRFDISTLLRTYVARLEEGRFKAIGGSLRWSRIGPAFLAAVAPLRTLRELAALPCDEKEVAAQLGRLLREPRTGTHPLRHLAVIYWLFGDWASFIRAYRCSETASVEVTIAKASQSASGHAAPDETRASFLRLVSEEAMSITGAARQTGIDTTTAMAWAAHAGIATPRRAKRLKDGLREGLIGDLRSGLEKSAAARKYGISIQTVTTTLRTEIGLQHAWAEARHDIARHAARSRWGELVAHNPGVGVKVLRSMAPAAYAWLYRNDRTWLQDQNRHLLMVARVSRSPVNWDERDNRLASEVRKLACQLSSESSGRPARLWQLYQQLPELKAKLSALDRLPLTRRAIEEVIRNRRRTGKTKQLF